MGSGEDLEIVTDVGRGVHRALFGRAAARPNRALLEGRLLLMWDTSAESKTDLPSSVVLPADDLSVRKSEKLADPGVPDGLKVDQQGNVYTTNALGIWTHDAQGQFLGFDSSPVAKVGV